MWSSSYCTLGVQVASGYPEHGWSTLGRRAPSLLWHVHYHQCSVVHYGCWCLYGLPMVPRTRLVLRCGGRRGTWIYTPEVFTTSGG